jgi:hypothetical protein
MKVPMSVVLLAGLIAGCASSSPFGFEEKLLDYQTGTTGRAHCTVVSDPFGGDGKVVVGELVEKGSNKTGFFNNEGFFAVPDEWKGRVVVRLAVKGSEKLRIVLVAKGGKLKSYYVAAPAAGEWCDLVLPLTHISAKIQPGERIVDISIWQLDGGKAGALYVDQMSFRYP